MILNDILITALYLVLSGYTLNLSFRNAVINYKRLADSNINALRQLIEDEKLQYDFGLGPLNMPTDAIVIMLIPPNSRRMAITKVAVVALPINFTDGLDPAYPLLYSIICY